MKKNILKSLFITLLLLVIFLVSLAMTGMRITLGYTNSNGSVWDKYSLQLLDTFGHYSAAHMLASIQLFQSDDEQERYSGFALLQSEAEQGSCYATGKIGWAYQQGLGVPEDLTKAVTLYREAAECGMTYWQILLAHAYQEGYLGLVPNELEATYWREKKPKIHYADYNCWVANYYENGIFPKNVEKYNYYQKACSEH